MSLILIRHTQLSGNAGVCYGRTEFPLAESFECEVQELIARLPWKPDCIYTSPSARCRVLAERLAGGAAMTVDARLAEIDFGAWEGKRWNELHGPDVEAWMACPFEARPPGGETAAELVARVSEFRCEILRGASDRTAEKRVAVVTHAGVIRAWRSLETGAALEELFKQPVAHGEIWRFDG